MKILCGTDFSEPAKEAAEVAAAMAARLMVPLHLIHCAADWLVPADLPAGHYLDADSRQSLATESLRLTRPGLAITTELCYGNASHHLVAAATPDVCFVLVGSTGKGAVQRLILGSVADQVAQTCDVPVLIVKEAQPLLDWLLKRTNLCVLCAAELIQSSDAALAFTRQLSRMGETNLEIGHIIPMDMLLIQAAGWINTPDADGPGALEEVVSLKRDMAEQSRRALGIIPQAVHVRESLGNPAYEFLSLAHERRADLIVLGSHHRHGIDRIIHPSFSRRILSHATTNVLCVPVGQSRPCREAPPGDSQEQVTATA